MRSFTWFFFVLILCGCAVPSQESSSSNIKGESKIVFDSKIYTFGTIKQDEIVGAMFHFRNEGTGALIIHRVEKGCGCTDVRFPQSPVQPGEKGTIEVIFDSKGFSGTQHKNVTVYCNDPQSPVQLSFSANVSTNY